MKKILLPLLFAFIGTATIHTAKAQTYDPLAVQRINDLIVNNGLQATPNAPETWEFATWNDETPKQLTEFRLTYGNLTGAASFVGLRTLQKLNVYWNSLEKIDLTNCTQLQMLNCEFNTLTEIYLTGCTQLQQLYISYNTYLSKLDLTDCTQLQILDCTLCYLGMLDLTNCTALKELYCSWNSLYGLDITHCPQLRVLKCHENYIPKLDLTNSSQLQVLVCYQNFLTELNLKNCTQIQQLFCYDNNRLTKLNLTNCAQLQVLNCRFSGLTELNLANCTQLQWVDCSFNRLTKLVLTNCTQLQGVYCEYNRLTELDLTGLDNLIECWGFDQNIQLILYENETGEYTHTISLNNPTFTHSAISYSEGILKSTTYTALNTGFTVQTNKPGFELNGNMGLSYSNVGINPLENIKPKVYLNPTTGILFVECENFTTIKLYDMLGKEVLNQNGNGKTEVNINHLPKGFYVVSIFLGSKLIGSSKIVKQ